MSHRFDKGRNDVRLIICIREDIPTKVLRKHNFPQHIEIGF